MMTTINALIIAFPEDIDHRFMLFFAIPLLDFNQV